MSKELVVVTGATGKQGGSVVSALLKDGKFKVRAVTRDANSANAEVLKKKGVEVVQANISNKEEVVREITKVS